MSSNENILKLDKMLDSLFKTNVNTDLIIAIIGIIIGIALTVLALWVYCKICDK